MRLSGGAGAGRAGARRPGDVRMRGRVPGRLGLVCLWELGIRRFAPAGKRQRHQAGEAASGKSARQGSKFAAARETSITGTMPPHGHVVAGLALASRVSALAPSTCNSGSAAGALDPATCTGT
ncbi:hypothetical protein PAHAL_2G223300 [Panicum hallii]|uniref:Uncharacterized protein n=1 Tax=Panicum hallii TaxID=206008 RepID=A0A2T8KQ01_9POAL|nr:hypothetical protein PAHAL_2G223300 [Panicum hallii]